MVFELVFQRPRVLGGTQDSDEIVNHTTGLNRGRRLDSNFMTQVNDGRPFKVNGLTDAFAPRFARQGVGHAVVG